MIASTRFWFGTLVAVGCSVACACSSSGGDDAGTPSEAGADAGSTAEAGADSSPTAEGGADSGPKDASTDTTTTSPCGTAEYGLPQATGTISFKANGAVVNTFSQLMESPDVGGILMIGANGTKADKHTGPWIRLRFHAAVGEFSCAPGELITMMQYTADNANPTPPAIAAQGTGNCKFNVTSYGAVGEPIVGTFEGLLLAPTNVTITAGTFNLTRCK